MFDELNASFHCAVTFENTLLPNLPKWGQIKTMGSIKIVKPDKKAHGRSRSR